MKYLIKFNLILTVGNKITVLLTKRMNVLSNSIYFLAIFVFVDLAGV